jgi:hypothetical protein
MRLVFPLNDSGIGLGQSLLSICDNNHCAALLLNIVLSHIEAWAARGDDPWIPLTHQALVDVMLHLLSDDTICKCTRFLEQKASLGTRRSKPDYSWDHTKAYTVHIAAMQQALDRREEA